MFDLLGHCSAQDWCYLRWIFTTKLSSDGHRTEQMRYDEVHTTIRIIFITLCLPYTAPPQNNNAAQVFALVALFVFSLVTPQEACLCVLMLDESEQGICDAAFQVFSRKDVNTRVS